MRTNTHANYVKLRNVILKSNEYLKGICYMHGGRVYKDSSDPYVHGLRAYSDNHSLICTAAPCT